MTFHDLDVTNEQARHDALNGIIRRANTALRELKERAIAPPTKRENIVLSPGMSELTEAKMDLLSLLRLLRSRDIVDEVIDQHAHLVLEKIRRFEELYAKQQEAEEEVHYGSDHYIDPAGKVTNLARMERDWLVHSAARPPLPEATVYAIHNEEDAHAFLTSLNKQVLARYLRGKFVHHHKGKPTRQGLPRPFHAYDD